MTLLDFQISLLESKIRGGISRETNFFKWDRGTLNLLDDDWNIIASIDCSYCDAINIALFLNSEQGEPWQLMHGANDRIEPELGHPA